MGTGREICEEMSLTVVGCLPTNAFCGRRIRAALPLTPVRREQMIMRCWEAGPTARRMELSEVKPP